MLIGTSFVMNTFQIRFHIESSQRKHVPAHGGAKPGGAQIVWRLRRSRSDVRQADLVRRPRVHRQTGARPDVWYDQGHALRSRTVCGERGERSELPRDSVSIAAFCAFTELIIPGFAL